MNAVKPTGGCLTIIVKLCWQPALKVFPTGKPCGTISGVGQSMAFRHGSRSRNGGVRMAAPRPNAFRPHSWTMIPRVCLAADRSEEHTSELQSLMRISYAVLCLKTKQTTLQPLDRTITRQKHRNETDTRLPSYACQPKK